MLCVFLVKSVRSNDGVGDHSNNSDDFVVGINGGGGDTFSPLYSALGVCVCAECALCWRAIIKSHCNFLSWCPLNLFARLPCQPIATSSYSSYSHEYARRFMIRSFDFACSLQCGWTCCKWYIHTSFLLRCQMDEMFTFKPRNLTAFLWLRDCLSASNKCILISNLFIKQMDFDFNFRKYLFFFYRDLIKFWKQKKTI